MVGVVLIILTQFNAGCATMIRGETSAVSVRSDPAGATIYIDGIRQKVPTPAKVHLSRTRHDIGVEKEGFIGQQFVINARVYWPATPLLLVDIIPLGAGVVYDLMSRGFLDVEPREVQGRLTAPRVTPVRDNQRILANRPSVPTGTGLIYVYHANMLPKGAKLYVSTESKHPAQAMNHNDEHESVVTLDMPVTFNVKPGRHVLIFRKLESKDLIVREIDVESNSVTYVRAMSTSSRVKKEHLRGVEFIKVNSSEVDLSDVDDAKWDLAVDRVMEREALIDLYYLNNYQNALGDSVGAPLPAIEGILSTGEQK
jgi:hypothetical protein